MGSSPDYLQREEEFARLHLWQMQPVRDIAIILIVIWLVRLGYLMSVVTVPLLLGLLLAYLLEPPISWLAKRTSRPFAAGLTIAFMAMLILVPLTLASLTIYTQGSRITQSFDDDINKFVEKFERFLTYFERDQVKVVIEEGQIMGIEPGDPDPAEAAKESAEKAEESGDPAASLDTPIVVPSDKPVPEAQSSAEPEAKSPEAEPSEKAAPASEEEHKPKTVIQQYATWLRNGLKDNFGTVGKGVAKGGAGFFQITSGLLIGLGAFGFKYFFLTPFFFFFWSISLGSVKLTGARLIPRKHREHTLEVIHKMDRAIAAFIRGRVTIAAILAVCYTIGYWIIGVPMPLLLGPIVGFASAVPYLPLIGWPLSMLALAIDQAGATDPHPWWWIILGPTIIYFGLQALDDYVLTPMIQGKNVGLSTPVILFAVLGAGALAGIYGVLIAIPFAACIKILITDVVFPRYHAWVEGRADDPLPIGDGDRPQV